MHSDALILIGFILAYGFVLSRYIPERFHFVANITASIVVVVYGFVCGLDVTAMGLGLRLIPRGIIIAAVCSLAVMLVVGLVAWLVPARYFSEGSQLTRSGKVAYETAVRIPLSTALSEEILFRGVLLAVLLQHWTILPSVLMCSAVFGIWHVMPSSRDHASAAVVPITLITAAAGVLFCWLRLLSGSIAAPWLLHWTFNASALLAIHFVHRKSA